MENITRRDFLKLMTAFSAGITLSGSQPFVSRLLQNADGKPNIIIFLFDAMSAYNLSVYNYPRQTTPNLERFAQRATVYHSHYSGGNFTSPGTASMLTGLYPWNHRAFNADSPIRREVVANNLFRLAGEQYFRVGFSQNLLADIFLRQFQEDLDIRLPAASFVPKGSAPMPGDLFPGDSMVASYSLDRFPFTNRGVKKNIPGSLLWGYLEMLLSDNESYSSDSKNYPYGLPHNGFASYQHPMLFGGIEALLRNLLKEEKPTLAYFHIFSPHFPYAPRKEFTEIFPPLQLPDLPRHPLASTDVSRKRTHSRRNLYDSFIADLDFEFGKMLDSLEQNKILDNSYVIVTSDHGELFGRGETGHGSPLLYDPVIRIPLLISSPGQAQRRDIYSLTSNTDLLPTISNLAGQLAPGITDGKALPGFGGMEDDSRSVYSMITTNTSAFTPPKTGSVCLIKGEYKLIYYFGYQNFPDQFEMYSLASDPEEEHDLYSSGLPEARHMKDELLAALSSANAAMEQQGEG